jgi:hypothetical protein
VWEEDRRKKEKKGEKEEMDGKRDGGGTVRIL